MRTHQTRMVPRFFAGREAPVSYPYWRYRETKFFLGALQSPN
jgi:hypothetical protein